MKKYAIGFIAFGVLITGTALLISPANVTPEAPLTKEPEYFIQPFPPIPITENVITLKRLDLRKANVAYLTEEVNQESVNKVINTINEKQDGPIYLLINSPGGSVSDGGRLISAMQASKVPVYTVCVDMCASMSAMILEYGTERYAVDRATLMFHPASIGGIFQGELDKIISRLGFMQRYVDKMDHYVAKRAKMTYEKFKALNSRELWQDSEDALLNNYIDAIVILELPPAATKATQNATNRLKDTFTLDMHE